MPKSARSHIDKVRAIVLERDENTCQCCGADVLYKLASIQHRIPRGAGGSARVDRPSNLVLVCGSATTPKSCHNWMEHEERRLAGRWGWLLPKNNPAIDPSAEPLLTHRGWRMFDDAGGSVECDPPAGAVDWEAS